MEFLANARLRAARILLVMCAHHMTSESCDIRIHAQVVLSTILARLLVLVGWVGIASLDDCVLNFFAKVSMGP